MSRVRALFLMAAAVILALLGSDPAFVVGLLILARIELIAVVVGVEVHNRSADQR